MANVSRWKNFEWEIARALGGKRRLRTMESFSVEAPDVYWPRKLRKRFPKLNTVSVECKKRKGINVHGFFVEAKCKYGKGGKRIILATRVPATKAATKKWEKLKKRLGKRLGLETKKELKALKRKDFITPLVTVELDFFKELWQQWLYGGPYSEGDLQNEERM